jgi:3-isopropylmalate/(R)-2-methylmalate dehydratase small subunit
MKISIKGKVWKYGDNIDNDEILPRYITYTNPRKLAKHVMEGIDPEFARNVSKGDVLVVGRNFGCGSSREQGVLALKGAGVGAIIAESFARIFFRSALSLGIPVLECPGVTNRVNKGDYIEIHLETGEIQNLTTGEAFRAKQLPNLLLRIIAEGGLIPHLMKLAQESE